MDTLNIIPFRGSAAPAHRPDGCPLAPVFQGLQDAAGVHSSQSGRVEPPLSQLDALAPVMAFVEQLGWDRPRVHLIDAEADSVGHFRHWHRAGYTFLVRADGVGKTSDPKDGSDPIGRGVETLLSGKCVLHVEPGDLRLGLAAD